MKKFAKMLIELDQAAEAAQHKLIEETDENDRARRALIELHKDQAILVERQIQALGWPRPSAIGDRAYEALFMIALNASALPTLMRSALDFFMGQKDAISKQYTAMLSDRIAYFERMPQLYGTQYDIDITGETVLWPLVAGDLDKRRQAMGLGPYVELDLAVADMDLGQGLKRQNGQYNLLYQNGWLCPSDSGIRRLYASLQNFDSGCLLGFRYSLKHYLGLLSHRQEDIDIILPLQHKEAFDQFIADENHVVVTKSLKTGVYALKDDQGFLQIQVQFVPFIEGDPAKGTEGTWVIDNLGLSVQRATYHSVNGWILSPAALLVAKKIGLASFEPEQEQILLDFEG